LGARIGGAVFVPYLNMQSSRLPMTEYGDFTSVKITVFAITRISVVFSAVRVRKVDSSGVNVVAKIVIYNSKSFIALQFLSLRYTPPLAPRSAVPN
jgi:hypothetical protein